MPHSRFVQVLAAVDASGLLTVAVGGCYSVLALPLAKALAYTAFVFARATAQFDTPPTHANPLSLVLKPLPLPP